MDSKAPLKKYLQKSAQVPVKEKKVVALETEDPFAFLRIESDRT